MQEQWGSHQGYQPSICRLFIRDKIGSSLHLCTGRRLELASHWLRGLFAALSLVSFSLLTPSELDRILIVSLQKRTAELNNLHCSNR